MNWKNSVQLKMRSVWLMLALPPILLGAIIVAYLSIAQLDPSNPGTDQAVRRTLPYILAVNHLSLFALLLFLLHRRDNRPGDIGWSLESKFVMIEILIGLGGALMLYLFKEFAIDSVRALMAGNRPTFTSLFNFRFSEIYIPMAVAATGLVFVEESIYRGLAIPHLRQRFNVVTAVLISSAFFGALHWGNGPFAIFSAAVIGLFFAGIFLWRGNLIACTVAHVGYNLLVLAT
jgi:membrane protease YdiL (CAAX protease family)